MLDTFNNVLMPKISKITEWHQSSEDKYLIPDVFREILEKHKLEILEKHKLLRKLTEKSYEGTLTEDEQVKFDELWPYCSVDGCDNRINRNGSVYYCYPHLSQEIESGVN